MQWMLQTQWGATCDDVELGYFPWTNAVTQNLRWLRLCLHRLGVCWARLINSTPYVMIYIKARASRNPGPFGRSSSSLLRHGSLSSAVIINAWTSNFGTPCILHPSTMSASDSKDPQPRNLVLCFDGTGNQYGEAVSRPTYLRSSLATAMLTPKPSEHKRYQVLWST